MRTMQHIEVIDILMVCFNSSKRFFEIFVQIYKQNGKNIQNNVLKKKYQNKA
jgi:hypothetical protein